MRGMTMLVVFLGLAAVLLASCGGDGQGKLNEVAVETCGELEGAIRLQVGSILSRGISRAEASGFSAPELGTAMRAECPELMAAIDTWLEEEERRENLPDQMRVTVDQCWSDGARGTVKNNSDVTVDVFIDVQFLDEDGVIVDNGIDSVSGLRAGESGKWEASSLADERAAKCRASVDSAYEQ